MANVQPSVRAYVWTNSSELCAVARVQWKICVTNYCIGLSGLPSFESQQITSFAVYTLTVMNDALFVQEKLGFMIRDSRIRRVSVGVMGMVTV